jgi:hypothetical protein
VQGLHGKVSGGVAGGSSSDMGLVGCPLQQSGAGTECSLCRMFES